MSKHLSRTQRVDIVNRYSEDLTPMQSLADKHGITRQGVYKIIKNAGVDTSKHKIPVSCSACGSEIMRTKARIRNQINHFCDYGCYYAYLEAGSGNGLYVNNRHGQRVARKIVSEHFDLKENQIVHHKDRNCLNNMVDNLMVFANQGDHIRYHRLGPDYAAPVWDGGAF